MENSRNESNKRISRNFKWNCGFSVLPEFDAMEFVALLANVRYNQLDHVLNTRTLKTVPVYFHDPLVVESHLKVWRIVWSVKVSWIVCITFQLTLLCVDGCRNLDSLTRIFLLVLSSEFRRMWGIFWFFSAPHIVHLCLLPDKLFHRLLKGHKEQIIQFFHSISMFFAMSRSRGTFCSHFAHILSVNRCFPAHFHWIYV